MVHCILNAVPEAMTHENVKAIPSNSELLTMIKFEVLNNLDYYGKFINSVDVDFGTQIRALCRSVKLWIWYKWCNLKCDIQFIEVQYHASQRRSWRILLRMRRQPYNTSERHLYRIIHNKVVVEKASLWLFSGS